MPAHGACIINEKVLVPDEAPGTVLLDYLRRRLRLTGTKEVCREGDCGACMVLLGTRCEGRVRYRLANSCILPLGNAAGRHVVTIEGLSPSAEDAALEAGPVHAALVREGAIQCGFCTPGLVLALTWCLLEAPEITPASMRSALDGNICRCTGYGGIRRAVDLLASDLGGLPADPGERLRALVERRIVPSAFREVPARLDALRVPAPPVDAGGTSRTLVAGGTDLLVRSPGEIAASDCRFLLDDERLRGLREEDGELVIGAATSIDELRRHALLRRLLPDADAVMDRIASTPVRHQATVAGNIVNASPIGDMTILLLPLDPELELLRGGERRRVPLRAFFRGYKVVDLRQGEIVGALRFRVPPPDFRFRFEKVSKRTHLDIASVNGAIGLRMDGPRIASARLSAGGVAPVPLLLDAAAAALEGREVTVDTLRAAIRAADGEISPISDVRGSAAYKRLLLRHLILAHFLELFPERLDAAGAFACAGGGG